jgi:hypothetical protein
MRRHASYLHNFVQLTSCSDRATAAIGGGHYPRGVQTGTGARLYRVRKLCAKGEFATVTQALAQWSADKQGQKGERAAIIEIADSGTYHEAPRLVLGPGECLVLRAADMTRPVLRMFEYGGEYEHIAVFGGAGSSLTIEGLLVAGGPLRLAGDNAGAPCRITLRHCTLVPGWDTEPLRDAPWRARPSLIADTAALVLQLDHCIAGALACRGRGATLHVADSIVDGGHAGALALSDGQHGAAMLAAVIVRSTVIGMVQVEELTLAENAIFLGALLAGKRTAGRVRHCYLAPGSHTPPREHCQPDLAQTAAGAWCERQRLQPRYCSLRYGDGDYCVLTPDCASEIRCGADDSAEMGAWHDLHRSPLLLTREGPVKRQARPLASPLTPQARRSECAA